MTKSHISCILILALCSTILCTAERIPRNEIDMAKVMQECNVTQSDGASTYIVMFMTQEYWESTLEKNKDQLGMAYDLVMNNIKGRVTVMIIDMDMSNAASIKFADPKDMEANVKVRISKSGKTIEAPISSSEEAKSMLTFIRPMLAQMMGQLGKGMYCQTYDITDKDGVSGFSVFEKGAIEVTYKGKSFKVATPLDSFHIPRKLPNGKNAHISWDYDPWTGKKIE